MEHMAVSITPRSTPLVGTFFCAEAVFSSLSPPCDFCHNIDNFVHNPYSYALGLGWYFIKYPTTVVSVSYDTDTKTPIVARSKDGVLITMDCSFEVRFYSMTRCIFA
jgi:hypothetical protein